MRPVYRPPTSIPGRAVGGGAASVARAHNGTTARGEGEGDESGTYRNNEGGNGTDEEKRSEKKTHWDEGVKGE